MGRESCGRHRLRVLFRIALTLLIAPPVLLALILWAVQGGQEASTDFESPDFLADGSLAEAESPSATSQVGSPAQILQARPSEYSARAAGECQDRESLREIRSREGRRCRPAR